MPNRSALSNQLADLGRDQRTGCTYLKARRGPTGQRGKDDVAPNRCQISGEGAPSRLTSRPGDLPGFLNYR